ASPLREQRPDARGRVSHLAGALQGGRPLPPPRGRAAPARRAHEVPAGHLSLRGRRMSRAPRLHHRGRRAQPVGRRARRHGRSLWLHDDGRRGAPGAGGGAGRAEARGGGPVARARETARTVSIHAPVSAGAATDSIPALRIEPIEDAGDPRLSDYRAAIAGTRGPEGVFLAEGSLVVRALLAADRFRTRSVLVTPAALSGLRDALAAAAEGPVYVPSPTVLRGAAGYGFSRGCLAAGEAGAAGSLEAMVAARPNLLVALDRVTDPDNVGAVFRTARVFGAGGILLAPGTGDPLYRKAIRV